VQVEHPVSELVTGVDIVEQQLRIARGEPLSLTQEQVVLTGHAIEARLCAEDPYASDTPQTGRVLAWHAPAHTRVDHAVEMGLNVTGDYDSLLAKVIVRGVDRADALQRLEQALADTCLLGVHHNTSFLRAVLAHPEFQRGAAHVELLDAASATLRSAPEPTPELVGVAALACVLREGSGGWTSPRTWSRPARLALGTRMFACEVRAAEGAGAQHHVVRAADADLSYQGVERRGDELKYETSTGPTSHTTATTYG
jgi:acetyl/propionyl-CoA carboxylase alpha subunit